MQRSGVLLLFVCLTGFGAIPGTPGFVLRNYSDHLGGPYEILGIEPGLLCTKPALCHYTTLSAPRIGLVGESAAFAEQPPNYWNLGQSCFCGNLDLTLVSGLILAALFSSGGDIPWVSSLLRGQTMTESYYRIVLARGRFLSVELLVMPMTGLDIQLVLVCPQHCYRHFGCIA